MWFRRIFNARGGRARYAEVEQPPAISLDTALSASAMRQLNRLRLNTGPFLPGQGHGSRPSQRRKPAMEFREHRSYTHGDDVRFVDWKASARQEHTFVKQGEQPKDVTVNILMDCSASMAWGHPSKAHAALGLAAALGYVALAQGDRLRIVPLGAANLQPLGPISGKGQVPHLLNYLRAIRFDGTVDLTGALAAFGRRSRGSLALVLSDLLAAGDFRRGLEALPAPTWNVAVCHLLHPLELDPAARGYLELQDVETGQLQRFDITPKVVEGYRAHVRGWQEGLANTCLEKRAAYSMIPTNWSLETETLPHLREAQVLLPL